MQQAHKSQRVEIRWVAVCKPYLRSIALEVEVKNMVVVVGIVSEQGAAFGVSHKLSQGFGMSEKLVMASFLDYRVYYIAKHGRNGLVGFDV